MLPQRKRTTPLTDDEELEEIQSQMSDKLGTLKFSDYQRKVAEVTVPWPIDDIEAAFRDIANMANLGRRAKSEEQHAVILASILRTVTEICDSFPTSLERIANISLAHTRKKRLSIDEQNKMIELASQGQEPKLKQHDTNQERGNTKKLPGA